MIQLSAPIVQGFNWKNQLAQAIKNPEQLLKQLDLPDTYLPGALRAHRLFPLRVPLPYLERIQKGNPNDPLLRQILPLDLEADAVAGYTNDPVGDRAAQKTTGLLQKYHGRALLITSSVCAVHCRYCFRRHFPYEDTKALTNLWREAFDYLSAHNDVNEVILSGGDPLSLSDERLYQLLEGMKAIPHLRTLRIHTRLPIVIPHRITDSLISLIRQTTMNTVIVVHINHAQEIDHAVQQAMNKLKDAGATLLNQSVLLAGVNDTAGALEALSHRLFEAGILPYYLHQLDRVNGAAHFAVPDSRALEIIDQLRKRLPGYLVPRLVTERAGEPSKLPLDLACDSGIHSLDHVPD